MSISGILLALLLFCLSFFGGISLFHEPQPEPPVCGGVTDHTDPHAPKEIQSKEITGFSAHFYLYDPYDSSRDGQYRFKIQKNEQDQMMLEASGFCGAGTLSIPVTEDILTGLQSLIDQYELVKMNGIDRVTAGLPPEYGPWSMNVAYASGESLSFYENGNPEADWTVAMKTFFEKVLAENGHEEVLPPKEARTINHFSIAFNVGHEDHHYGEIYFSDGEEPYFYHSVYDMEKEEPCGKKYAPISGDFFASVQALFEAQDFDILHNPGSVHFDLPHTGDGFLEIYVDYENGRQIYAELTSDQLPENWIAMRDVFMAFCDEYIAQNEIPEDQIR